MLTTSVTFFSRDNLPFDNINAALILSKKVKVIERNYIEQNNNAFTSEHKAFALSCIYTLVGFLESSINDLYANAKDNFIDQLSGIENHITKLATYNDKSYLKILDKNISKCSQSNILRKYQYALQLLGLPFLDPNNTLFIDVTSLIHIRNYFIHHFASWINCSTDNITKYGVLKGRFKENPYYYGKGNAFFPDKVVGYGLLQWGISNSIQFVLQFYDTIGLNYYFIKQLKEIYDSNIK
jgi:hypothetical protein